MVRHQPIEPQLLDRFPELVEVHRLLDVAVNTQLVAVDEVAILVRGREYGYWNRPSTDVTLDRPQYFEPIDLWQFQVEDHEFWRPIKGAVTVISSAEKEFQSLFAVAHDLDDVAQILPAEHVEGQLDVLLVVFDQENFDFDCLHAVVPLINPAARPGGPKVK